MADVKWIKITTDIFDDEKILLIESLPDAYAIITVWFKLLCLAGKQNNSGVFMMGRLPYTDKMLATIFRMKEATVTMALQTFEQFGMVEIVDGVITIPNWGKHQSLEQLEERRNYQREYQREYRKKQKLLAAAEEEASKHLHKHLRKQNVNSLEEEKEKEEEKEIDKEVDEEKKRKKKKENPAPAPEKHKRGEYQHVLLSDEDEDKLIEEYGMVFALKAITFLDEYIEETGYKRKNHYLCIKRWVIDAVKEKEEKAIKKSDASGYKHCSFDPNEAIQLALNRTYKTVAEDEGVKERMEALKERIGQG